MAGIIKAAGSRETAPHGAQAFQFADVGQAYVGSVRSESAKIVAQARREAAQIKARAEEEGKQAAIQAVRAALRSQLDQQLASALKAMQQAVKEIADSRQAWQRHWEERAVKLGAAIAARVIRRELDRTPDITLTWVREALQLAAGSGQVVLRLHPQDLATVGDRIDAVAGELHRLGPLQVVADEAISPGGCKVETVFGSIDQQIEAQLARLEEELLG
ncbi:MAG TPA: FliH/SctL family protein [Pirellulaceae bacterium]|nr:FliH/SctL family protein [Pirellulaceae bacterium]